MQLTIAYIILLEKNEFELYNVDTTNPIKNSLGRQENILLSNLRNYKSILPMLQKVEVIENTEFRGVTKN